MAHYPALSYRRRERVAISTDDQHALMLQLCAEHKFHGGVKSFKQTNRIPPIALVVSFSHVHSESQQPLRRLQFRSSRVAYQDSFPSFRWFAGTADVTANLDPRWFGFTRRFHLGHFICDLGSQCVSAQPIRSISKDGRCITIEVWGRAL
jgi:hypothetical protein